MRPKVLALDYDGTIARDGRLDADVRAAIGEVRARGLLVVLVTGRILDELREVVGGLDFVDAIVAENGAVYTVPRTGQSHLIGRPASRMFLAECRRRGIGVRAGECIVEADAEAAPAILSVIRELELPLVLLFNRGRLMVLPQAISKSTGLRELLTALRRSVHNTIGVGDAENDHELLTACEVGVAVAWGSAALKAAADEVLEGTGPEAVAPFIRGLHRRPVILSPGTARRRLLLGHAADGARVALAVRGRNVLVAGAPRSGKSWVTGLLCEQLILHGYSLCVIDPEGDYTALEPLPDVVVAGGEDPLPRPREVMRTLRHPDVSLVIDLSKRPHAEKRAYVATLLPVLAAMRRRYGVPHRIVLDEAHYFLTEQNVDRMMDLETHGYTLVTYQASSLPRAVLAASEAVIVSQESDLREVEALSGFCARGTADVEAWGRELESLALGDAAILPCAEEAAGTLRRIALVPRLTSHVRHRAKYLDVPVAEGLAFVFTADGRPVERTDTLKRFIEVLGRTPVEHLGGHLRRRDFSRWLDEVYGDHPLARQVNALEEQYRSGLLLDVTDAIVAAVRDRYEVDESSS